MEPISFMTQAGIKIGDDLDVVKSKLQDRKYRLDVDGHGETARHGITLFQDGISINFKYKKVSAIFFHIYDEGFTPFSGQVLCFDESFWSQPNENLFKQLLSDNGYTEWSKKYPFATDMLNKDLRIRLTWRDNFKAVSIDDGSFLRGSPGIA